MDAGLDGPSEERQIPGSADVLRDAGMNSFMQPQKTLLELPALAPAVFPAPPGVCLQPSGLISCSVCAPIHHLRWSSGPPWWRSLHRLLRLNPAPTLSRGKIMPRNFSKLVTFYRRRLPHLSRWLLLFWCSCLPPAPPTAASCYPLSAAISRFQSQHQGSHSSLYKCLQ